MRHAVKGRKLKRTTSHKKALLENLAIALLRHKKIKTTVAKAKEARIFVEKLITKARKGDLSSRRYVARFIKDREVLKELFSEILVKIGDRPGGYTRVVKIGSRRGDGADLAILELVDYNEGEVKSVKKKEEKQVEAKKDIVDGKEEKTEAEKTAASESKDEEQSNIEDVNKDSGTKEEKSSADLNSESESNAEKKEN